MENTEMKYRIKVEPINGNDEELDAEYRMGIECEGFAIIAGQGKRDCVALHDVNTLDIATATAKNAELIRAAYLAIGIEQGKQAADRLKRAQEDPLAGLIAAMQRAGWDE